MRSTHPFTKETTMLKKTLIALAVSAMLSFAGKLIFDRVTTES